MSASRTRQAVVLLSVLCAAAGCRTREPLPLPEPPVQQQELTPDVAQAVAPTRALDNRPYELIWDPRREARDVLVDFEFVLGWTIEADPGLVVSFDRSQVQQLWGAHVGKIAYRGTSGDGHIELRPPEPIELHRFFDSVNLWVYGPGTAGKEDAPRLWVQVEDAGGTAWEISLGPIDWGGWNLMHVGLSPVTRKAVEHPCRFVGLRLEGCRSEGGAGLFLDSLSFYTESLGALSIPDRPRPNLPPGYGPSMGRREGGEVLSFPVVEDTVLPPVGEKPIRAAIVQANREGVEWSSKGADGELGFRFNPRAPADGIEVLWKTNPVGRVLVGGGVQSGAADESEITVLRSEGELVHVEYADGLRLSYRVTGRSLVIEMQRRGGDVSGFDLGRFVGPGEWHSLSVPGLESTATVGWLDAAGDPLFTSAVVDWYRSNATELYGLTLDDAGGVHSWGGVRYRARSEGQRPDLVDRVVVTVAPELDAVLPAVANPPSEHVDVLSKRIWVDSRGPISYVDALQRTHRLATLGMTNVVQCHLQSCWQDDFESCTLRTNAAPRRGGDAALQKFLRDQQAAGWWTGLYINPMQIHSLNAHWSEDLLQRAADGAWVSGLPAHYQVKAPSAVALQDTLTPVIRKKFKPDVFFVDELSAEKPWEHVDFDVRVAGAGSFAQFFYGVGELMDAQPEPVLGAGGLEAMYAGLLDGYVVTDKQRPMQPYLPIFCLQRLAPLAAAFGGGDGWAPAEEDRSVDRMLAAQLAYGAMGRLAPDSAGAIRQCRSYYSMLPIQQRFAGRVPDRIAYWNGQYYLNTSEAIANGDIDRSQLYLLYEDVLELWVNGSATEDWEVRVGRDTWVLPPYGWVAVGPELLAVSVRRGDGRIDYVSDSGTVFYDGRGQSDPFRGIASATPVLVQSDEAGMMVCDLAGGGMLAVGEEFGVTEDSGVGISVRSSRETAERPHPFEWTENMLLIRGEKGGPRHYRVELTDPGD